MEWLNEILKDEELTKKIKEELPKHFIPKNKFNEVNDQLKETKGQLSERDTQLKELGGKAKGNEELENTIKELQSTNETVQKEYEQKLQEQAFDYKLEQQLANEKARNPKAVKALLDMDTIKLDGDNLKGLEEQMKQLKENESYLFEQVEEKKPSFTKGENKVEEPSKADAWIDAFKKI